MKRLIILAISVLATSALQAKVELPSIFSDNMVLQQKENVAVWGTASGKKVTISATWSKQKTIVTPDADGKWFVRIPTPEAGGPYDVTFNDGEKTILHNVLIGEVWFCGGQSNMDMPMRGWAGQPVEHSTDYILRAKPSVPIRICDIPVRNSTRPLPLPQGSWKENTPENIRKTSAVAYFFACKLYEILEVPVGGFEIAGEDRVFHPATATAYKNVVTVTCDEVPNPVAVRYCFRNWGEGTLWNSDGIPLLPFRTDGWDDLGE